MRLNFYRCSPHAYLSFQPVRSPSQMCFKAFVQYAPMALVFHCICVFLLSAASETKEVRNRSRCARVGVHHCIRSWPRILLVATWLKSCARACFSITFGIGSATVSGGICFLAHCARVFTLGRMKLLSQCCNKYTSSPTYHSALSVPHACVTSLRLV